jgi:hypothetical protein
LDASSNLALYQSETTTFGLKASLNFWYFNGPNTLTSLLKPQLIS